MATYYVDSAAGGANNGTSWTDAWTSIQSAFTAVVSGDIVYCRGTQTLTVTIDANGADGDHSTGLVKFIGCNASGTNDGTRFVLDGNSAATYCVDFPRDYYHLENFEFKNATSSGLRLYNTNYNNFVNCSFNNNGDHGVYIYLGNAYYTTFIRCVAYSNTNHGFYTYSGINCKYIFCRSRNNGGDGFYLNTSSLCFGCISDNNTGYGIYQKNIGVTIINCVVDANAGGGIGTSTGLGEFFSHVIGNRITNHAGVGDIGFDAGSFVQFQGWNYFENNTGNNIQNSTNVQEILDDGASTTLEDQSDTLQGYTDLTDPEDYNLSASASLRSVAINIPES